jgi:hypothetical protein
MIGSKSCDARSAVVEESAVFAGDANVHPAEAETTYGAVDHPGSSFRSK